MYKKYKILVSLFLFVFLLFAFTPPLNPLNGGWTQQFMPNLSGQSIKDITFLDSLKGYAITSQHYILKTANGGDNWSIIYNDTSSTNGFSRIEFINQNTGFVGGFIRVDFNYYILKTTNGGLNWFYINAPFQHVVDDMFVLNQDTIWIVDSEGAFGGVFRTTNGGVSWQVQYQYPASNPNKIYMYDKNFGFISTPNSGTLYRTTNSGVNWNPVTGTDGFDDIRFINSLTGWKASGYIRKTTNGGLNWVQQIIPSGGIITGSAIRKLSVLNMDTIWAVGGSVQYPNLQSRGILYRTINSGQNWLFQIPDTNIHILGSYSHIKFINNNVGWAYTLGLLGGIHTTTGGDTGWLTDVTQISNEVPKQFKLYQNYPNPFNPSTIIRFQIQRLADLKLIVYDVTGKEITRLTDKEYIAGSYEISFDGSNYSSGIYFYSLFADGKLVDTKKMLMIK